MSYPLQHVVKLELPTSPRELGPERPVLFHPMHRRTFEACVSAGRLLSTADTLKDSTLTILGVQEHVRSRLARSVARPFAGRVADAVPLAWTPHTRAVLASCGRVLQAGAERVLCDDIVIALVALSALMTSRVPLLFADRNPLQASVVMSEDMDLGILPWSRLRTRAFSGAGADPQELARYGAETLVWLGIPLFLVAELAVRNDKIAAELNSQLATLGKPKICVARPGWFFN